MFEERPWTILNFAIIGNETRYHSAGDDLAALDRRSLQHMGDQALGIARALAADGVPAGRAASCIYADFYGRFLVTLPLIARPCPARRALPRSSLVAGVAPQALGRAAARRRRPRCSAPALLAFAADFLVGLSAPATIWRGYPAVTFVAVYAAALLAAAAALLAIGTARRPGAAAGRLLAAVPAARRRSPASSRPARRSTSCSRRWSLRSA